MNLSKPGSIALVLALLVSSLATLLFAILIISFYENIFWPALIFGPVLFIISYVIIRQSINRFIYEKLKIIYRTIGNLKTNVNTHMSNSSRNEDVLDIVNQAVLEWSKEQKMEIDELKKMAAYRREFLGNVSHELKTPIFNIQGYVLTLLDGGIYDEEINMKYLARAKKSVNRLIAIVEDLEEISKFESGELVLKKTVFDLNILIREVIDYMDMKATAHHVKVKLHTAQNDDFMVRADQKRIRQVLINLIDNAIKYGDQTNGKVDIWVYDFHDYYLTEITDNGSGIPEEFLFRVFERFFRTDTARSRQKGGSGLGLAIVKHIIEAHQQKISVRNNHDKGSTFSFTLKKV